MSWLPDPCSNHLPGVPKSPLCSHQLPAHPGAGNPPVPSKDNSPRGLASAGGGGGVLERHREPSIGDTRQCRLGCKGDAWGGVTLEPSLPTVQGEHPLVSLAAQHPLLLPQSIEASPTCRGRAPPAGLAAPCSMVPQHHHGAFIPHPPPPPHISGPSQGGPRHAPSPLPGATSLG